MITNVSVRLRPRMCVSGRTSSRLRANTSSITSRPDDRLERVGDRGGPRRHLLGLGAGQEPELLAADGEDRAEHEHPLVGALLEHGVEPGGERQDALAGAGGAADG